MNKKEALELVLQDGRALSKLSKQFRQDEDIVKKALSCGQAIFHFASQELRDNKQMAQIALQFCIKNYNCLSQNLKKNKELNLFALHLDGQVFNEIPKELKSDEDIILNSISTCPHAVSYANEETLKKKEFIEALLKINGLCLASCPKEVRSSLFYVNIALQESANKNMYILKYVSDEIKNNKCYMIEILNNTHIKDFHKGLSLVGKPLQDDVEIVLNAIKQYKPAIQFASKRIQDIVGEQDSIEVLEALFEKEKLENLTQENKSEIKKIKI